MLGISELKMRLHLSKKTGEVTFKLYFMAKAVANKLCRASYFIYCFPVNHGDCWSVGQKRETCRA